MWRELKLNLFMFNESKADGYFLSISEFIPELFPMHLKIKWPGAL